MRIELACLEEKAKQSKVAFIGIYAFWEDLDVVGEKGKAGLTNILLLAVNPLVIVVQAAEEHSGQIPADHEDLFNGVLRSGEDLIQRCT